MAQASSPLPEHITLRLLRSLSQRRVVLMAAMTDSEGAAVNDLAHAQLMTWHSMMYMTPQAHIPISTPATRLVHISIGFTCITTTILLQGQAVHTCAVFRQSRWGLSTARHFYTIPVAPPQAAVPSTSMLGCSHGLPKSFHLRCLIRDNVLLLLIPKHEGNFLHACSNQ